MQSTIIQVLNGMLLGSVAGVSLSAVLVRSPKLTTIRNSYLSIVPKLIVFGFLAYILLDETLPADTSAVLAGAGTFLFWLYLLRGWWLPTRATTVMSASRPLSEPGTKTQPRRNVAQRSMPEDPTLAVAALAKNQPTANPEVRSEAPRIVSGRYRGQRPIDEVPVPWDGRQTTGSLSVTASYGAPRSEVVSVDPPPDAQSPSGAGRDIKFSRPTGEEMSGESGLSLLRSEGDKAGGPESATVPGKQRDSVRHTRDGDAARRLRRAYQEGSPSPGPNAEAVPASAFADAGSASDAGPAIEALPPSAGASQPGPIVVVADALSTVSVTPPPQSSTLVAAPGSGITAARHEEAPVIDVSSDWRAPPASETASARSRIATSNGMAAASPTEVPSMDSTQLNEVGSRTVTLTMLSVSPVWTDKPLALASVEIDIDGVLIEVHGILAAHVRPAGVQIELPMYQDGAGMFRPAVTLPDEVRRCIGDALVEALNQRGVAKPYLGPGPRRVGSTDWAQNPPDPRHRRDFHVWITSQVRRVTRPFHREMERRSRR